MKLTRVTITGVDDKVDHFAVLELFKQFPFLELGILYSYDRVGTPRYPSDAWRQQLFAFDESRFSMHLCGQASRDAMAGDVSSLPRLPGGWRVQLNGFSRYRLPGLALAMGRPKSEIILQCNSREAVGQALALRVGRPNVVALLDASGGAGRYQPDIWPQAPGDLPLGYAGGINEFNVEDSLRLLADLPGGNGWIDLETGARNQLDEFDFAKAQRILHLAAPFVEAA